MLAVYAMGAGLGHLTRMSAALHVMERDPAETVLFTTSRHSLDPRVVGDIPVERPPDGSSDPARIARWLTERLFEINPSELWVDVFPGGLRGELSSAQVPRRTRCVLLARLLRWRDYASKMPGDPIRFTKTLLTEPVERAHGESLMALSESVEPIELRDPPAPADLVASATIDGATVPRWLVAHAGSPDEIRELVAFARDQARAEGLRPSVIVAVPSESAVSINRDNHDAFSSVVTVDAYPLWPLFDRFDRVITACGFNAMRQASALGLGDRHRFMPFPRLYDDQFERARRRRAECASSGAGPTGAD